MKFELEKLRIQAEKEVRIAAAQSLGLMLSKANMQIFGDPETMSKMSTQFLRAASMGVAADGFMKAMPDEGKELIERLGVAVMSQIKPTVAAGNGAVGTAGTTGSAVATPVAVVSKAK